jgi:hypothetical protein
MLNNIILAILGFVLTTVAGGILGHYLQTRSWRQQDRSKQAETERRTATQAFDEISRLMDKRLYRMRLLYWRLKSQPPSGDALERAMTDYRDVLFEWNDSLNRTLAMCEMYFGLETRRLLEGTVYETFTAIGGDLEAGYRSHINGNAADALVEVGIRLDHLGSSIYVLNCQLIGLIQSGDVGTFRPGQAKKA